MKFKPLIRKERSSDIEAIWNVTAAAFKDHPFSENTEQLIINELRKAGALTISLVAELNGQVVGHIALSPVTISDGTPNWYALGPVSVLPAFQNQGIGKSLILEGLSQLKNLGAEGCVLVGDPKYYERFGFRTIPDLIFEGVPQEVFLALPFHEKIPCGSVIHHEAFSAKS